jgi:hypothetical protein
MNRSDIRDTPLAGGQNGHGEQTKTPSQPRRTLWQFADLGRKPALGSHRSIHGSD